MALVWVEGGFSRKHPLRQSLVCRMLSRTALGITTCGREGEKRLGKVRSRAAMQAKQQPQPTHEKAVELEELFSVVLSWEGMVSLYTPIRISHRMGEATGRDLTLGKVASQLRQTL